MDSTVGGVDWISATIRSRSPQEICADIGGPSRDWIQSHGHMGYSSAFRGDTGAQVLFTPDREDAHLVLPGKWMLRAGELGQRRALTYLADVGATFTRIDLQLTDEARIVEPRDVWASLQRGEAVTRVRKWRRLETGGAGSGESVYIGAPKSLQQLVVYDKEAESGGEFLGVRWELRVKDEAAETLADQLLLSGNWGDVWAGRVVALVDFRDVNGDENSGRRPRSSWFEVLVGAAQKMTAYPPRPARTYDQLLEWLDRQVAPSLALLVKAEGGDLGVLDVLVMRGSPRLSARHFAMLDDQEGWA